MKWWKSTLVFIFGSVIGIVFPLIFIALDLAQLELKFTFINVTEIFKTQYIYLFSTITFPLIAGIVNTLLYKIYLANKELLKYNQFIDQVINSMNDLIVVTDQNLVIKLSNDPFVKLLGKSSKKISTVIPAFSDMSHFIGTTKEISLSLGKNYQMLVNCTKTNFKNENLFIISLRDVSELKENEKIIEQQRLSMETQNHLSSLGEMASGIGHEINNPLMIIQGYIDIISRKTQKQTLTSEELLSLAAKIKETIIRIVKIVTSLRIMSRDGTKDAFTPVEVSHLIQEAVVLTQDRFRPKGIEITTEINYDGQISAREVQIGQVLINLINNAADAISNLPEKWIKISAKEATNGIDIIIMDSGHGIPPEICKKIFEPFFTTKEVGKGTGLGLSISSKIIKEHNGELSIDQNCKNTCFVLHFPKFIESNQ